MSSIIVYLFEIMLRFIDLLFLLVAMLDGGPGQVMVVAANLSDALFSCPLVLNKH